MTDVARDVANLVTQDLLRVAKAMAEESAKAQQDAIATMGLTNIRGTVVAVDADNKVQIRRSTSLNDDETPGPADPGFYPVASPGVLPQVGDLVWGFANNGGAVIMGKEAAAGYRDIPAVDASVSAVKAGGVDDFSLLNAKYATGSNDARTVQDESLTGAEVQNRSLSGSTDLAVLSVTGGELASRTITASQKLALSSLTDNEVTSRTLTGNSIALENVGSAEVSDGSMRTNEVANQTLLDGDIANRTITGFSIALENIGSAEIANGSVRGDEIQDRDIGGIDIGLNSVGSAEIGADAIGNSELAASSVGTGNIINQSILGEDIATDAIGTRELNGSDAFLNTAGHTHSSTVFIRYPQETRREWLANRKKLVEREEIGLEFTPENFEKLVGMVEVLSKNLETALKLHMDYKTLDAETREEMFDADPEWLAYYDEEYFVGRWEGYEPERILSQEEREERRHRPIEDGRELAHSHFKRLPW